MLVGSITFSSSLPIGGGVAGRDLAVADDAVERRAHHGALQLLARRPRRARGGRHVALGGVAAHFGVVQRLRRGHAGGAQGLQALELALGLVERLAGGARAASSADVRLSRIEVSSSLTSRSPLLDRLAVFLQHLQDDGRDFGAQVGAALGLDRAGDDGAGRQRIALHRQHVFRSQHLQACHPCLASACAAPSAWRVLVAFAAGGQRRGNGKDEQGFAQH